MTGRSTPWLAAVAVVCAAGLYWSGRSWMTHAGISASSGQRSLGATGWLMLLSVATGIAACLITIRYIVRWLSAKCLRLANGRESVVSVAAYVCAALAFPFAIFLGMVVGGTVGGGIGDSLVRQYGAAIGVGIGVGAVTLVVDCAAVGVGTLIGIVIARNMPHRA